MAMAERRDKGLLLAVRVLPMAIILGSRFTAQERRQYERIMTGVASGKRYRPEKLGEALSNSTQGLGGASLAWGLLAAFCMWMATRFWFVPFVILSALAFGALVLFGTLACIYAVRSYADRVSRQSPRRSDLWWSVGAGIVSGIVIVLGRLAF
jgi:hypothetical protein